MTRTTPKIILAMLWLCAAAVLALWLCDYVRGQTLPTVDAAAVAKPTTAPALPLPVMSVGSSGHLVCVSQAVPPGISRVDLDKNLSWTVGNRVLPGCTANFLVTSSTTTVVRSYAGKIDRYNLTLAQPQRRYMFYDTAAGNDANTGTDANHPKKTPPARFTSHVWVYFNADHPQDFSAVWDFTGACTDVTVGRYGAGARAIDRFHCNRIIKCDGGTREVTIINQDFSSTDPQCVFGQVGGQNVAMVNCRREKMWDGIYDAGVTGLLLDGDSADVTHEYALFLTNAVNACIVNPDYAGSIDQITCRFTGDVSKGLPGLSRSLVYGGSIRQPQRAAKSPFCIRVGDNDLISGTQFVNSEVSTTSETNYATSPHDIDFLNCTTISAKLAVYFGSYNINVSGGTFNSPDSECLSVTDTLNPRPNGEATHAVTNVTISGVRGTGAPGHSSHCLVKTYMPSVATPDAIAAGKQTATQAVTCNGSTLVAPAGTPLFRSGDSTPQANNWLGTGNTLTVGN